MKNYLHYSVLLIVSFIALISLAPTLQAQEMAPTGKTQVIAHAEMAETQEMKLRRLIVIPAKKHSDTDYAENMLSAMYEKAKASNATLTKRAFVVAFHDKAVAGDVTAGYYYGAARLLGYGIGEGPNKEVEGFIGTAAKAGNHEAERDYSLMYVFGMGVEKSMENAYLWAKKSGDSGLASGKSLQAEFLQAGAGTKKDEAAAAALFKQAAEAGDPIAAINYGRVLMAQQQPDYDAAIHFYTIAAKATDDRALSFLGVSLLEGRGSLTKDDKLGVEYIQSAATIGNAGAQDMMGDFYGEGSHGVEKSALASRIYYEAAAANGDTDAQIDLGVMYLDGTNGLAKDHDAGMALMMKAAKAGNDRAAKVLHDRL